MIMAGQGPVVLFPTVHLSISVLGKESVWLVTCAAVTQDTSGLTAVSWPTVVSLQIAVEMECVLRRIH